MEISKDIVFLSYARQDERPVFEVFRRLKLEGIRAWFDKECIKPGEEWEVAIRRALKSATLVLVFLSENTITRGSFLNKEIREAIEVWKEKPPGTVYLIPVRLTDVPIHELLAKFHWVNLFEETGWIKLLNQIKNCLNINQSPSSQYVGSADISDRRNSLDRRKKNRINIYLRRSEGRSIPHIVFPEEVVRFVKSCLPPDSWASILEDSKRFIATLGCKLEPIIQIVPPTPTPLVLGFECLGLGSLGENFTEICRKTNDIDTGVVRLCLAVVSIKTIAHLRTEAIKTGHHGARNLIFSINLDPFMIDSPYLKIFLKWYFNDIAHNVVFEVNETTTKQYLGKLKNLQVDYNLKYSADDLNNWHPEVRDALISRVEMTKMDYRSFIDAMEMRGNNKEETLTRLLAHNLNDKPLIVEGIQDADYLEFLVRHWDFRRYGHLYGQGYIIESDSNLRPNVRSLKEYGLSGGNFLIDQQLTP